MAQYIDVNDLVRKMTLQANRSSLGEIAPPHLSYSEMLEIISGVPTADVVPKSEVDKWYHEYHAIKDALKQEKIYHRETEKLADKYCVELQTAKAEVAIEIFEEIDKIRIMEKCCQKVGIYYDTASEYEELKKKYTIK